MNQGRPVRSVRRRTEATRGRAFQACCKPSTDVGHGSRDARLRQDPDLDRLIARAHGDPARPEDRPPMMSCLTTAGCPSAERKALTEPTGGASPVLAPVGVDSPLVQLRHQGRAVLLRRRRKARDEILGREGKPSQSPLRKARRQTLYTCLVQPQVDARIPNESLAPVSRASSATSFTENWIHSVPSGVRPLDFRDHIPVRGLLRSVDSVPVMGGR